MMRAARIAGALLLIAGTFGLAYGGFSYAKGTHQASVGPIELPVTDRDSVKVPVWLGFGALFAGAVLLTMRSKA